RPEVLSEAAWLIKRAVDLDPEEPLYWVRRALVAQAPDEPDKALESVFVAHAMSPVVTAALDPSRIDGFVEADKPYCEIVCLACDSCPPGIIGELNRITCLMEEQGARLACQAGELFPTSFDCFEGLPDYGILIPGLNAGLSILTPFGELHVSIDGDGVVHWKAGVKFPAGRLEPGAGAAGTRHVGADRRGHGDPDGPVRQGHRARRQRPGQVPNHRQVRGVGAQRQPVRREAGVGIPRRRPAARGHGVCRDRQHNGVDGALMSGPGAVRTAGTVVGGLRARSWADCGHGRGRTSAAFRVRGTAGGTPWMETRRHIVAMYGGRFDSCRHGWQVPFNGSDVAGVRDAEAGKKAGFARSGTGLQGQEGSAAPRAPGVSPWVETTTGMGAMYGAGARFRRHGWRIPFTGSDAAGVRDAEEAKKAGFARSGTGLQGQEGSAAPRAPGVSPWVETKTGMGAMYGAGSRFRRHRWRITFTGSDAAGIRDAEEAKKAGFARSGTGLQGQEGSAAPRAPGVSPWVESTTRRSAMFGAGSRFRRHRWRITFTG